VLGERGFVPDFVRHSLGEYAALVAAKSLRFRDAVRLVRHRGRYMQERCRGRGCHGRHPQIARGQARAIPAEAAQGEVVSAANFNSPDQVVIAGHAGAVERAMTLAKAAGARRVVPLPVSAPFHCALMKPAQERCAPIWTRPNSPISLARWSINWQAREIRTGAEARRACTNRCRTRCAGGKRAPAGRERRGARVRGRRRFRAGRPGARDRSWHLSRQSGEAADFDSIGA